jgi:hypothetical protein
MLLLPRRHRTSTIVVVASSAAAAFVSPRRWVWSVGVRRLLRLLAVGAPSGSGGSSGWQAGS